MSRDDLQERIFISVFSSRFKTFGKEIAHPNCWRTKILAERNEIPLLADRKRMVNWQFLRSASVRTCSWREIYLFTLTNLSVSAQACCTDTSSERRGNLISVIVNIDQWSSYRDRKFCFRLRTFRDVYQKIKLGPDLQQSNPDHYANGVQHEAPCYIVGHGWIIEIIIFIQNFVM
jgi:hypothetical protein